MTQSKIYLKIYEQDDEIEEIVYAINGTISDKLRIEISKKFRKYKSEQENLYSDDLRNFVVDFLQKKGFTIEVVINYHEFNLDTGRFDGD